MEDDFYLPRYLDEPERMIIWTAPEFMWISVCSLGGLLVKQAVGMLVGLIFSLVILKLLNNVKNKYGKRFLSFWCYRNFPPINKIGKIFPPSHIRKWFI
ncbi:MAG: type IV conjugative transfer system protein TraL [Gammaproteobacteria bacterium 39-13]|nr:type IV conjugative transfer system protein TraL [Gammaproteobacteria bacterium]OJV94771.1 MAG: type IV conjugative transfer system protein TraL [Gammaproteobacteria bacterium 39-13]